MNKVLGFLVFGCFAYFLASGYEGSTNTWVFYTLLAMYPVSFLVKA